MGSAELVVYSVIVGTIVFTLLSVYAINRWVSKGPFYFKTDLTDEQEKAIGDARERMVRKYWAEDALPFGDPIFKRGGYPHFNIAFYKDGIEAPFVNGRMGIRRFVPYEAIIGVYPVEWTSPSRNGPSQGLQIETVDYETFLVRSWYYDLGSVIGMLEKGIGSTWDRIYRTDVLIRGEIWTARYEPYHATGGILVHNYIRSGDWERPGWDDPQVREWVRSKRPMESMG
jgi:hypothetical protein